MRYFLFIIIFLMAQAIANPAPLSLELSHANLPDTIRLLARFLHINVVISKEVSGTVSLNIQRARPLDAFDLLLSSQGLAKQQIGDLYLIAPLLDLMKTKQNEQKWEALQEETAPLKSETFSIQYTKALEIARLLESGKHTLFSKGGKIRADARTNIIWVEETEARLAAISHLIHELDRPIRQILIEARLASVDSDFERELGLHFGINLDEEGTSDRKITQTHGRYSLAVAKLADGSLLDVKLAALENAGHAELISSPSLFAANQQAASIESGEEVPYQEVSESGGTAIVFKKAVLGLKVVPQILPGNRVLLQLQINQDRPSNKMVLGMPTISTRQMTTSVLVRNGQTIVLGGVYETNKEKGEQGLPFLNRIPFLGALLSAHHTRENKRELLIFVTPKIL